MTPEFLFILIVTFIIINFILETGLDYLNQKSSKKVAKNKEKNEFYDDEKKVKALAYSEAKFKSGLVNSIFSFAIILLALFGNFFSSLDNFVRNIFSNEIIISLGFFAILGLIITLLGIPFSWYETFVIEEKFGFNKTTKTVFITDTLKSLLISALLAGVILTAILFIYQNLQEWFWVLAWVLIAGFSLFMFMFGTSLIIPLFNKLTPVEEGELKNKISQYCQSQGFSLKNLFVMDGSKRSTKANAFFSGLGKSKTIVLFDTLIEKLETDEIVAVLAHEIGHYKKKHTFAMFILSNVQTFIFLFVLGWLLGYPQLSQALGVSQPSFHIALLAFVLLFSPISLLTGIINNSISRRNEFEADTFAKETNDGDALKTGLVKITTDSLSNLNPHPWYVKVHYTHPPLKERLSNLQK
ncbi:MAG: M48 family metallopeptidase [Candidatus Nanopelagicales bacterium]